MIGYVAGMRKNAARSEKEAGGRWRNEMLN